VSEEQEHTENNHRNHQQEEQTPTTAYGTSQKPPTRGADPNHCLRDLTETTNKRSRPRPLPTGPHRNHQQAETTHRRSRPQSLPTGPHRNHSHTQTKRKAESVLDVNFDRALQKSGCVNTSFSRVEKVKKRNRKEGSVCNLSSPFTADKLKRGPALLKHFLIHRNLLSKRSATKIN